MARKTDTSIVRVREKPVDPSSIPPHSDARLVERAIDIINDGDCRPRDSRGAPGGLLDLPEGLRPIIIGDLHACVEHLGNILDHDNNRRDLDEGRAYLLFVGDILHDDRVGYMRETANSIQILNQVLTLVSTWPGRVFYIRGNHDTFDERLRKSGVAQGADFKKALVQITGQAFTDAVARWFDALPYFAIGDGFVIVHAGPIRGGCTREEIIDIWRRPDYAMQFMWNRVNEFHGNPSPKEYGETDIRMSLETLGLPPLTHFIVGHNPLWNDGGTTGLWENVIGIKNHHIIYSGSGSKAPYYTLEGGALKAKFSKPEQAEVYYYG